MPVVTATGWKKIGITHRRDSNAGDDNTDADDQSAGREFLQIDLQLHVDRPTRIATAAWVFVSLHRSFIDYTSEALSYLRRHARQQLVLVLVGGAFGRARSLFVDGAVLGRLELSDKGFEGLSCRE